MTDEPDQTSEPGQTSEPVMVDVTDSALFGACFGIVDALDDMWDLPAGLSEVRWTPQGTLSPISPIMELNDVATDLKALRRLDDEADGALLFFESWAYPTEEDMQAGRNKHEVRLVIGYLRRAPDHEWRFLAMDTTRGTRAVDVTTNINALRGRIPRALKEYVESS